MIRHSFCPIQCRLALDGASLAVIDLETTGLGRQSRIVTAGVLVGDTAYTLFTRHHCHISSHGKRITTEQLREALAPLQKKDLTIMLHNALFDLGFLARIGVVVNAIVQDTQKLLKLIDPDRLGRRLLQGDKLNNRLKPTLYHLFGVDAPEFPGDVDEKPMEEVAFYLINDLVGTRKLYDWLMARLSPTASAYNTAFMVALCPILLGMQERGVAVDCTFIRDESANIQGVLDAISSRHHSLVGQHLGFGPESLRELVYETFGCDRAYPRWLTDKARKQDREELRLLSKQTRRERLSVCRDVLLWHRKQPENARWHEALGLVIDYQLVATQLSKLTDLLKFVFPDGLIHSVFSDHQASGRISSTKPNLQSLPGAVGPGKTKYKLVSEGFENTSIRVRNALVARPQHTLVAFDIGQADIRVLAYETETFNADGEDHIRQLRQLKNDIKEWKFGTPYITARNACGPCRNLDYCSAHSEPASFDQNQRSGLAEDFRTSKADFYTTAAERMLGSAPSAELRDHMKRTILGIVNGKGAVSLSRELGVSRDLAKSYLEKFAKAYPQESAYLSLLRHVAGVTGALATFQGRERRVTPHTWMVNEGLLDLRISYRNADKLWLRVIPLRGNRHTLTCYVINAADCNTDSPYHGREIYHHQKGRRSTYPYRFFKDDLLFRLPIRNVSWSRIREVRMAKESARYEGFDRTSRQLINHVFQGGTADIVKTMMLRMQDVCAMFCARLLLNIHDELVYEVPDEVADQFTQTALWVLELRPTADFEVPIVVEPKVGKRFDELAKWQPIYWWD